MKAQSVVEISTAGLEEIDGSLTVPFNPVVRLRTELSGCGQGASGPDKLAAVHGNMIVDRRQPIRRRISASRSSKAGAPVKTYYSEALPAAIGVVRVAASIASFRHPSWRT